MVHKFGAVLDFLRLKYIYIHSLQCFYKEWNSSFLSASIKNAFLTALIGYQQSVKTIQHKYKSFSCVTTLARTSASLHPQMRGN